MKVFKICIRTVVDSPFDLVKNHFDKNLFVKLNPPFPKATLLRYDGNHPSDEVWIKLHFIFFSNLWKSLITQHEESNAHILFVDQGIQLPFFLSEWKHIHKIELLNPEKSLITDEVYFYCHNLLVSILMYPFLYSLFVYRIPIYKRFFRNIIQSDTALHWLSH